VKDLKRVQEPTQEVIARAGQPTPLAARRRDYWTQALCKPIFTALSPAPVTVPASSSDHRSNAGRIAAHDQPEHVTTQHPPPAKAGEIASPATRSA